MCGSELTPEQIGELFTAVAFLFAVVFSGRLILSVIIKSGFDR